MHLTMCRVGPRSFCCWFYVNRSTVKKFFLHFPSLCPFHLRTTSPFTSVRSKITVKYKFSTAFQYWVNTRYASCVTDRQTDRPVTKTEHFRCWNVFDDMCRMLAVEKSEARDGRWIWWCNTMRPPIDGRIIMRQIFYCKGWSSYGT